LPGKPVSVKDTDCDEPLVRVRETVPVEEPPGCKLPELGETPIEKPNRDDVTMKVAFNVTGLSGMLKEQGLLEHEIPV
jgi:hypothetical protein